MIRNVESRLRKLEAVQTPHVLKKWHLAVSEAQRQAMIESGEANEADGFIFLVAAPFPAQFPPVAAGLVGGK